MPPRVDPSVAFDLLFMAQHYILYRSRVAPEDVEKENGSINGPDRLCARCEAHLPLLAARAPLLTAVARHVRRKQKGSRDDADDEAAPLITAGRKRKY